MSALSRRGFLALTGASAALAVRPAFATGVADAPIDAAQKGFRHALTVFGEPMHGPDFEHFDYVNPYAPKGGDISLLPSTWTTNGDPRTYDTFNMFILRGGSPPGIDNCYASLMTRNFDEPDAVYAFVAEGVEVSGLTYAFALRPGATFADGSAITAHDVVDTLTRLRADGHPMLREPLQGLGTIEAPDERTAVLTFAEGTSSRLPLFIAVYPIGSRAYFEANGFDSAGLTKPLASGAYEVGDYREGQFVDFVLREDWWGADVPSQRGHNNFGRIRMNFFRDRDVAFEAFKVGEITFREEFTSKIWATQYGFPAVDDGRVVQREFPDDRPAGAQGWFFNLRREKFADPRVREALGLAFDFEHTNKQAFYGLYERTPSYFVGSDMMAQGEPSAAEVTLLEPFRNQLPDTVFGPALMPPTTDGSGNDRENLRRANDLLLEAGFTRGPDGLLDPQGEPFEVEILYAIPTFDRVLLPLQARLERLGIATELRFVDSSQYQDRLNNFDFDIAGRRYSVSPTPGEEMREFFASRAADVPGSNNLAGIRSEAVDALLETAIKAETRDEMVTAMRALDRVLRAGHYWIPNWYKGVHTVAYWADEFGLPEEKPRYAFPVMTTWWSKKA